MARLNATVVLPSRSLTTFDGVPAASSSVAWVCRRSCSRILGSRLGGVPVEPPAADVARGNRR